MDGSFLFLFAQSVSGLIASFLFIAIQLFNATATALNCISQICCFHVALFPCLAIKFSGGTFSIRSSTLQFSARARRSSVSACALLMSFCRCSYCWMVRTGTSACPASSDWLNPANVRMAFRFVSGFAARYNSFILSANCRTSISW